MKNKEIILGAIVGIATTVIGTLLFMTYVSFSENASLGAVWDNSIKSGRISSVIAWGAALNFVAFFGFLKYNKENHAKGVLIMTILTAVFVMIHKLFG
ncbi:hypothetical protein H2O64_12035 [Kordia sp. YSTF-M3]|uniref:DUF3784 domain-containing protein n=1 Tax=Kordia aestuariivivens TaxID=2759037 RepID=A0ABR7QA12_9FLAO|nr:hypothetical protein [Kordia aestuariivivens]MBC8755410.1 hypothetical protein [Kordia aestuariivivens]